MHTRAIIPIHLHFIECILYLYFSYANENSVDNQSVNVKSRALQSIYAEHWGLKCSFTNPSDRMQK